VKFPGKLDEVVARWLDGQGGLAEASAALSASYRKGESSAAVSLAAYVSARIPATFAANARVHASLAEVMPGFAPQSLLDIGAGPGTASWAAVEAWSSISDVTLCEREAGFVQLARELNEASDVSVLQSAKLLHVAEQALAATVAADLVVASYVLAELPLETMPQVAERLWSRTQQALVMIEPGTPQGFARLRAVREQLIERGAHVVAPCTHQLQCPMSGRDWCHFKTRVQRSRVHMHAKQATVPFEDEAFAYLVVARALASSSGSRVIAPPAINKVAATLRVCAEGALQNRTIASRDKAHYKRAKKITWGDVWE
jgi:ribosomal protein RSM22 (predicted rRNA methylase)